MADPVGSIWTDPALTPPVTVTDLERIRHCFYKDSVPMFVIDAAPGQQRIDFGLKFVESGWTEKCWPMSGGKYASVSDEVQISPSQFLNGFSPLPTDNDIPPVEDLALEYAA